MIKNRFLSIVNTTAEWTPSEGKSPHQFNSQELSERFGMPYYLNKDGVVTGINEAYWAGLHNSRYVQLYESDERIFYRYHSINGCFIPVSENAIKQEIADLILEKSRTENLLSLERKKTNTTLNHVVAHLKGIAERRGAFNRKQNIIHVANGVIVSDDSGDADLFEFLLEFLSRNQSPIPYVPSAKCERFLNELLLPAVSPDDVGEHLLDAKYTTTIQSEAVGL